MKHIVIFGAGNVATHLFQAFSKAEGFKVVQVFNHTQKSLDTFKDLVPVTTNLTEVFPADIYLFAITDEAISLLANKIEYKDAFMLHTSGATPLSVFKNFRKKGVFYPLQTFSKAKPVDFKNIPLCIEAGNQEQLELLEQLAGKLSQNVYKISSEQRKSLHVAAVFVSNFVNFLYSQGEEICSINKIPFEILHPLILETASKITKISPLAAQTGPAKRGDETVIKTHLLQLNNQQKNLYELLTNSIKQQHGKEL